MNTRTFLIAMALLVASSQALFRGKRYNRNAYRYRYDDDDSCSDDNRYVVVKAPKQKSHSDKKWKSLQVNTEIEGESRQVLGNLVDNQGQPIIRATIPVESQGQDPQDIVNPLKIVQGKNKKAKYSYKAKNSDKSCSAESGKAHRKVIKELIPIQINYSL